MAVSLGMFEERITVELNNDCAACSCAGYKIDNAGTK
jgi:hypothetical protein